MAEITCQLNRNDVAALNAITGQTVVGRWLDDENLIADEVVALRLADGGVLSVTREYERLHLEVRDPEERDEERDWEALRLQVDQAALKLDVRDDKLVWRLTLDVDRRAGEIWIDVFEPWRTRWVAHGERDA